MTAKCALLIITVLLLTSCLVSAQEPFCEQQVLYFQNSEFPDIPGYEDLTNYPSGNTSVDESVVIKNTDGPVLIDSYILPAESISKATVLKKGLREFTTFHYVDSNVGVTQINFTAFQRFANGTEVVFYSQLTDDIDALETTPYTTYRVSTEDLKLNTGDRLGIKVYGETTHSSYITLHFVYQGTTTTSHFHTGYFDCPAEIPNDQSSYAPAAIMFAIVGGMLGAIIVSRRGGSQK